jgi:rhodanese-related sulfurtransferase
LAVQQGFTNVSVLQGGLPAWEERGYAVYAGPGYEKMNAGITVPAKRLQELLQTQADSLQVVDVREPEEFAVKHLPGAINLPMSVFRARANELSREKTIILYCLSGGRSYTAIRQLRTLGFSKVGHVTLEEWESAGLPLILPKH